MNNADFWKTIDGIIADGFTPEGLQKRVYFLYFRNTQKIT